MFFNSRMINRLFSVYVCATLLTSISTYAQSTPEQSRREFIRNEQTFEKIERSATEEKTQVKETVKPDKDTSVIQNATQEAIRKMEQAEKTKAEELSRYGDELTSKQWLEIEAKFQKTIQKINLDLDYEIIKSHFPGQDFSKKETGKAFEKIQFVGNTRLTEDEIVRSLPVIYVSKENLNYDFYEIKKLIMGIEGKQSVSEESMTGLCKYIVKLYQKKGLGGIWVYITEKENTLIVNIQEASIAKVNIEYYAYDPNSSQSIPFNKVDDPDGGILMPSIVREWSPAKEAEMLNERQVQEYCNLLNQNPDRYVMPIISRNVHDSNKIDLDYRIYEQRPWRFYVQSDNSGPEEREWNPTVGIINTNLTGRDDKVAAVYQGPLHEHPLDPFDENYSVYSSYDFPLFTPRLRMTLYTGHSNYDIDSSFPGGSINFLGSGDFSGGIMRFNLFQTEGTDPWFLDLKGSINYEKSTSNPSIGIDSSPWWYLWGKGIQFYRSQRADKEASTFLGMDHYNSFDSSDRESFEEARTDTDPKFGLYSASVGHNQYLDKKKVHKILGSYKYVWVEDRMVPAKMMSFGGLYSVRGYEEDEFVADGGQLISAQYEFDLVKYFEPDSALSGPSKTWLNRLALVGFTDYGRAKMEDPVPGEKAVEEMASVGCGVTTEVVEKFNATAYYGIPMRATEETDRGNGRWNFIFTFVHQF